MTKEDQNLSGLWEKVKSTSEKLKAAEEELKSLRVGEAEDDKKIEQILITIKELETSNKFMKDFLYRSLKWTILILSLCVIASLHHTSFSHCVIVSIFTLT